jgi:hypothetical protein
LSHGNQELVVREDWHLPMFLISARAIKAIWEPIWRCKVDGLVEIQLVKKVKRQRSRGNKLSVIIPHG